MSDEKLAALNEGEKACLRLVAQGFISKQIARQLPKKVSEHTVDQRLRTAIRKLEVSSRHEAARLLFAAEHDCAYQPLISQSPSLDHDDEAKEKQPAQAKRTLMDLVTKLCQILKLPLIGGRENDLIFADRLLAACRVAFISTLLLVAAALIMKEGFKVLS